MSAAVAAGSIALALHARKGAGPEPRHWQGTVRPRVDVSPARRDVVTGISRDLTRPIADAMCDCGSGDSFHALWRRESARSGPFILCSHLVISISPSRAHQRPVTLPRKNGVNRGASPEKMGTIGEASPFLGKNG